MTLCGLWHGAAWHFVAWGILHALALMGERSLGWGQRAPRASGFARVFAVVLVFHLVCLGWILFRCEDMTLVGDYLAGFTRLDQPSVLFSAPILSLIGLGLAMNFLSPRLLDRVEAGMRCLPFWLQGGLAGAVIIGIDAVGPQLVAPFIYFQF
jgi:hypothetical protein